MDDGFCEGDVVSDHYDAMIGKLNAWAPTRDHAIGRMRAALQRFEIGGIDHNLAHLLQVLDCDAFRSGEYDTGIVKTLAPLAELPAADPLAALLAAVLAQRAGPSSSAPCAAAEPAWAADARNFGLRQR